MGVESAIEQGLKTAFEAYTDTLAPDKAVTFRCFFLDDESGMDTEDREYPFVQITASPNVPESHGSTFRACPVEVKWATHNKADPKKTDLVALYENCRTILDNRTGIAFAGYTLQGVLIESGGESGVDNNEQYITLPLSIRICGA